MIRRTLHLLVLLLALTTGLDVSARAPVVLGAETTRVNLTEHMDWLTDAQGTLTLEEARQRSDFVPLPKALSEGFTSAAIWLRFDVQPQTPVAGSTWMLEVANALLDVAGCVNP